MSAGGGAQGSDERPEGGVSKGETAGEQAAVAVHTVCVRRVHKLRGADVRVPTGVPRPSTERSTGGRRPGPHRRQQPRQSPVQQGIPDSSASITPSKTRFGGSRGNPAVHEPRGRWPTGRETDGPYRRGDPHGGADDEAPGPDRTRSGGAAGIGGQVTSVTASPVPDGASSPGIRAAGPPAARVRHSQRRGPSNAYLEGPSSCVPKRCEQPVDIERRVVGACSTCRQPTDPERCQRTGRPIRRCHHVTSR